MIFNIITIFPEMFPSMLQYSLAGKALEQNIWQLNIIDLKEFASDKHKTVDDKPYGGGNGMLLKPDILGKAIDKIYYKSANNRLIYLSPHGKVLNQNKVIELSTLSDVTLICGRFEGIDHRIIEHYDIEEISLGDFILSGGEPAAMILMDSCIRLLPGVLANTKTIETESFNGSGDFAGLLEYPQYTRPAIWKNIEVPEVLLSGNHQEIDKWKLEQAKALTSVKRHDLWLQYLQKQSSQGED
jgi:tRNA (guanine37-N1)-methyltransferase